MSVKTFVISGNAFDISESELIGLKRHKIIKNLNAVVEIIFNAFSAGNKILLCGNGGSAADAQHIAAELTGRFFKDRTALFAEALHVNSSYMTAVANDYGFEKTYSRLLEAKGDKGDVLIAISTSGNSQNIVNAVKKAKEIGMSTISFNGQNDSKIKELSQICLQSPSTNTARIQEIHILFGHIICQLVEEKIFSNV